MLIDQVFVPMKAQPTEELPNDYYPSKNYCFHDIAAVSRDAVICMACKSNPELEDTQSEIPWEDGTCRAGYAQFPIHLRD